jgi:hypothetical protein
LIPWIIIFAHHWEKKIFWTAVPCLTVIAKNRVRASTESIFMSNKNLKNTKNIVYKEILTLWKGIVFCFIQVLYFLHLCPLLLTLSYPFVFQVIEEIWEKKRAISSVWLLTYYWLDVQIIYNLEPVDYSISNMSFFSYG